MKKILLVTACAVTLITQSQEISFQISLTSETSTETINVNVDKWIAEFEKLDTPQQNIVSSVVEQAENLFIESLQKGLQLHGFLLETQKNENLKKDPLQSIKALSVFLRSIIDITSPLPGFLDELSVICQNETNQQAANLIYLLPKVLCNNLSIAAENSNQNLTALEIVMKIQQRFATIKNYIKNK